MSLPLAARGPVSAALGRDERSYRVLGLRARNPTQGLGVAFSRAGVTVAAGKTRVHLSLIAYGHGRTLERVGSVAPEVLANRVAYPHAGVREWYTNGPLGLEQGFDVARAPARGRGALTLSLALSGDVRARLQRSGVLLRGQGAAMRYGGLSASDARGHTLHSWLELAPGRVLIHVDDGRAVYPLTVDPFVQQAELSASDGAKNDGLGFAVAVSGNTIVAGAPFHKVGANARPGAAYVFTMPASGWANATQSAELTASDGASGDELGYSVATSGNTIVAGAPEHKVGAKEEQGAAYVFTMPASGWANATQSAELTASDGGTRDLLGDAVAVSGNTIVAGARFHRAHQGAAYVFTMPASGWANATQSAELTASDGAEGDKLGYSVAVSVNTIVAGAPEHNVGANEEQGAAYMSTNPPSTLASGSSSGLPLPVSRVRPTISRVHQSHSTWRLGSKRAQISANKKAPVGTKFSLSLNVPAVINFTFTQRVSGRKVTGKCVAQTKRKRRRRTCQPTVRAAHLSFIGHSGTNQVAFQGRISRSNTLKPGHYTLLITAENSAGHSSPHQLTFTIVR